ncbi:MAG: hypothetical protein ACLFPJ_03405 [Candidatus Woesearchaeota archaeon]
MKNIIKPFIVVFALLSVLPLTMAQPDITNEVEQEIDVKEIMPFETNPGAEMRLLQLERAIHMNIIKGETVLEYIEEEVTQPTIDELEAILISLIDLKEEVSTYEIAEREENIEAFMSFKQEASALTKEFRDTARIIVDGDEVLVVRNVADERAQESIVATRYQENINEKAMAHNEETVRRNLQAQGIVSENLVERIRNKEIEPQEIRGEVMNLVREVRDEQANEVLANMRDEATKQETNAKENVNRIKEEVLEDITEKARKRIKEVKDRLPDDVKQNISERIKGLDKKIPNRGGLQ